MINSKVQTIETKHIQDIEENLRKGLSDRSNILKMKINDDYIEDSDVFYENFMYQYHHKS